MVLTHTHRYISVRSSLNRKKARRKRASTIVLKLKESKLAHSPLRRSDSSVSVSSKNVTASSSSLESRTKTQSTTKTSENIPKPENTITDRRGLERFTRFCDFFLVVGRGAPTKKSVHRIQKSIAIDRRSMLTMATQVYYVPQLLTRYPTTDYKDTPLPELHLLLPFIHPLGVRLKHSPTQPRPTTFHFVLTDEKKYNLYVVFFFENCLHTFNSNTSEK